MRELLRATQRDDFQPRYWTIFVAWAPVQLRGFATSPSETITDAKLAWSSSVAGALATGHSVITNLPAGTQTITLTATDTKGGSGTASITVNVVAGLDVPSVTTTAPSDYHTCALDGGVDTVNCKATDPRYRDTHIEVADHMGAAETDRVIVELSPAGLPRFKRKGSIGAPKDCRRVPTRSCGTPRSGESVRVLGPSDKVHLEEEVDVHSDLFTRPGRLTMTTVACADDSNQSASHAIGQDQT